jgi:glycosyltransferase involved in cell wall biosynthesis
MSFLLRTYCATYNQESYIIDALKGFVMQETTFPVVYTIVDDASTDLTAEVIREFVKDNFDLQDSSVAYEKDTDYGHVTFARHKTNKNCYFAVIYLKENHFSQKKPKAPYLTEWMDTKYVAYCEGDDYWTDPLKLQKQVGFLEGHEEYGFVGTNVWLDINGVLSQEPPYFSSGKIEGDFVLMGDVFEDAKYGPVARTVSVLYKNEVLQPYSQYASGDILLEAILAKYSKYAFYQGYASVYRVGVGISSSGDNLEKALRYNDWYVNCRRIQNALFPDDCNWNEDELEDRGTYIRLIYAIKSMNWIKARKYKKALKTTIYKKKSYSHYLFGPISCVVLWIALKCKHHE